MTNEVSVNVDVHSVDDFMTQWNSTFRLSEMSGIQGMYEIVVASNTQPNIKQNLDNGRLNSNVTIATINGNQAILDCPLVWNGNENTIRIANDVTLNIGATFINFKAFFIRHKSSGYVMGYWINDNPIEITNKVIFEANTILWSINYE